MSKQIEMTTAQQPPQKILRQNVALFGNPIPMTTTFSFATVVSKNPINTVNTTVSRDIIENRIPEKLNSTWTPFNTSMAIAKDRENSFITWLKQIVQKATHMVPSGFYYTGRGDVVQCFFCGLMLKHWARTDNAFDEHKKHSPECKFQVMIHRT